MYVVVYVVLGCALWLLAAGSRQSRAGERNLLSFLSLIFMGLSVSYQLMLVLALARAHTQRVTDFDTALAFSLCLCLHLHVPTHSV